MQVTVVIMNEDAELIQQLLNSFGEREPCSNSHGNLNIAKLAQMLLEDVALAWRRPGSWEGANISQVLTSHGYET